MQISQGKPFDAGSFDVIIVGAFGSLSACVFCGVKWKIKRNVTAARDRRAAAARICSFLLWIFRLSLSDFLFFALVLM